MAELRDGGVRTFEVSPEDAGVGRADPAALKGGDAATNAAAVTALLAGEAGAFRDIVLLNSAAALIVAGTADDLQAGAALAAESIDSGKARSALDAMIAITTGRV